jgi:hypothetical protein
VVCWCVHLNVFAFCGLTDGAVFDRKVQCTKFAKKILAQQFRAGSLGVVSGLLVCVSTDVFAFCQQAWATELVPAGTCSVSHSRFIQY